MRSSMSHFPVNTDMIKQSTVLFELIVSPFVRAAEKELVHPIFRLASWDRFDARPTCVRTSSSSTADVVPVPGTYDFVITKDYCQNNTPPWDLDTTNLFFTNQGLFKLQDNKP
ncbi:hypothetical protein pipiens_007572 [Culex pipiens pipiens]|uniref:Uncharacterized protein n=1 Tax=Culex pipiens pipiens TaxID=38569 RepID=A0ABD1DKL5_CULPP